MSRRCFPWLNRAWALLPPAQRMQAFYSLPEPEREECWKSLGRRVECDHWNANNQYREDAGYEALSAHNINPPRVSAIKDFKAPQTRSQGVSAGLDWDVLHSIPPPVYFEAVAGVFVPAQGGTINCVLPDHEDLTPSLRIWPDAGGGWNCFGCGRGGTVIDLIAYLTGLEPRGAEYIQIRELAAERLLEGGSRELRPN